MDELDPFGDVPHKVSFFFSISMRKSSVSRNSLRSLTFQFYAKFRIDPFLIVWVFKKLAGLQTAAHLERTLTGWRETAMALRSAHETLEKFTTVSILEKLKFASQTFVVRLSVT